MSRAGFFELEFDGTKRRARLRSMTMYKVKRMKSSKFESLQETRLKAGASLQSEYLERKRDWILEAVRIRVIGGLLGSSLKVSAAGEWKARDWTWESLGVWELERSKVWSSNVSKVESSIRSYLESFKEPEFDKSRASKLQSYVRSTKDLNVRRLEKMKLLSLSLRDLRFD